MGLYWRPTDKRARLLATARDQHGRDIHHCSPLTNLKLIRDRSNLQLCRARHDGQLEIWTKLNFYLYEKMVLFYCTLLAMKHQDARGIPRDDLVDRFELETENGEQELYGGCMVTAEGQKHALRLFRDHSSGVVRLEACALRGPMKDIPLWTAFVTRYVGDPDWVQPMRGGIVSLAVLKPPPYVFLSRYRVPHESNGEYLIRFDSTEGATFDTLHGCSMLTVHRRCSFCGAMD